ncbi:MAG: glycosyltransferase family 2 protein [Acidiferrobacterales bacterium]|nr:glycosyltransferase family 2 protein [Acidiferrobacterales bacterium]
MSMQHHYMRLSIVTTLYCSENYIDEFYSRVSSEVSKLKAVGNDYEIVFVDDGSPDSSLRRAIELSSKDERVKVVELSKNHGHHRAMMIGLEYALGEIVFLIDCDLEEVPENLSVFWRVLEAEPDTDFVYGVQKQKEASGIRKILSQSFYKVFNALSYVQIPGNELVSRLMRRNYVDALLQYKESELFISGVWADAGFNGKGVLTQKVFNGESSYTVAKRVSMAIDAVTSFSTKPLLYVFYLGFCVSMLSLVFASYLVVNKIFFDAPVTGWTSILVSLYLIGGLIIFCIGAVGIYLSRIFSEVKQRPLSLVRKIHQKESLK